MKRNQHRIRYGQSVHSESPVMARKPALDKTWHNLLTWNPPLDEDALEALSEALRPRRLRAG